MSNILIDRANPNSLITRRHHTLHLAAAGGWVDGLDLLLDRGASINAQDARLRETPLHKAARNLEMATIKILCARGTNTELRNIDGLTYESVLGCAQRNPKDWHVEPKLASFVDFIKA